MLKQLCSIGDAATSEAVAREDMRRSMNRQLVISFQASNLMFEAKRGNKFPCSDSLGALGPQEQVAGLLDSDKAYANVEIIPQNIVDIETLSENLGNVLEGRFLLCRTIVPPACLSKSLVTVVEDIQQTHAVTLDLHNFFVYSSKITDSNQILPSGSFLAVKNPCLKPKVIGNQLHAVQCLNSPSQVEVLSYKAVKKMLPDVKWQWGERFLDLEPEPFIIPNDNFWSTLEMEGTQRQTGEALKRLGDAAFIEKRFTDAIQWYKIALDYDNDSVFVADLLCKRAGVFLSLRCFYRALDDCNKVLEKNESHVNAVYRKTKALIGLRQYEEAAKFISEKLITFKVLSCDEAVVHIAEAARNFASQVTNDVVDVDMMKLLSLSESVVSVESVFEFIGPLEQVLTDDGKGRGLVAAENIRPGQLLLSTKAFALTKNHSSHLEVNNLETSTDSFGIQESHEALCVQIAYKLHYEPESGPEFYELFAGPELQYLPEDSDASRLVDINRIRKIIQYNCFGTGRAGRLKISEQVGTSHTFTAVWILPSLFNHSCSDANATWSEHGDVLIVRAIKPIQQGEQIQISYVLPSSPYDYRVASLLNYSFLCNCRLCELDKLDKDNGNARKRSELLKELPSLRRNPWSKEIAASAAQLMYLRKHHPKLNVCLTTDEVHKITSSFYRAARFEKSRSLLEKIHSVEREVGLIRNAVLTILNILRCCLDLNDLESTLKWVSLLKEDLVAAYGSIQVVKIIETESIQVLSDLEALGINFFA